MSMWCCDQEAGLLGDDLFIFTFHFSGVKVMDSSYYVYMEMQLCWGRQLHESTVQNAEMEGFLLHLQNERKEAVIKEETGLHVYSSKDVEM